MLRMTYVSLLAELALSSGYSLMSQIDSMIDLALSVLKFECKRQEISMSNAMVRRSASFLLRCLFDPSKNLDEFLAVGSGHWSLLFEHLSRLSELDSDCVVKFHCSCALQSILMRFEEIVNS